MVDWITAARDRLRAGGTALFPVDDLTVDDDIDWSGSPLHVVNVHEALDRRDAGACDYLCVRTPDGRAVAKGGMRAAAYGPGQLWQLAVHPELQGLGLGTRLIAGLEAVAVRRGLDSTWLGVELRNPRARTLYERLGYLTFGEEDDGWDAQQPDGTSSATRPASRSCARRSGR